MSMSRVDHSSILFCTTVLLLWSGAGGSAYGEPGDGDIGATILQHRMRDLNDEPASLNAFEGEVLVVNFWASWCAPCRRELPVLDRWNTEWQGRGARVVAVSIDTRTRRARRFVAEAGLNLTAWIDGNKGLAAQLDLPAIPTTYVIDQQGRVVLRVEGSSASDLELLHATVQGLLSSASERPGV